MGIIIRGELRKFTLMLPTLFTQFAFLSAFTSLKNYNLCYMANANTT